MQLNYMCIHCEEKGAVILLENVTEVAQQRASFSSHPHSMWTRENFEVDKSFAVSKNTQKNTQRQWDRDRSKDWNNHKNTLKQWDRDWSRDWNNQKNTHK